MKSIKEFKKNEDNYIICNSQEEFSSILKLFNPLGLLDSYFQFSQTTIAGDGCYCNDIKYMKRNHIFYCNASEILNQSYEIY